MIVALVGQSFSGFAASKPEDWVTRQGDKFRATPVDVIGPFALFLTVKKSGKRITLSQLSEEDCGRFQSRIADGPQRALRWVNATSETTRELLNKVRRLDGETFVHPKFDEIPEPEFLMLLFLSHAGDRSRQAAREFIPEYQRVRTRFPELSEAVFVGVRHKESDHNLMARQLQMPWLIEDFRESDDLRLIRQHVPAAAPTLMILTRTGVPIAFSECKSKADIERAVLEMEVLLNSMRPGNRRAWPDRLYFYKAVRLGSFRTGRADPLLVGHLLDLTGLRVAGIKVLTATLKISAEGQVTSAAVQPSAGITSEFGHALGETLLQSAMVPAVENGQFVEGTYELRLEP